MSSEFNDIAKELHAVNKCAKVIARTIGPKNDLYKYLFERATDLTKRLKSIEIAVPQYYPSGGNYHSELSRTVGNYEEIKPNRKDSL